MKRHRGRGTSVQCGVCPAPREPHSLGQYHNSVPREIGTPDDPFVLELRARFGARIIDGLTPAAPVRHDERLDDHTLGAGDSDDLDDPDDLSDLDHMVDD